MRSHRRTRALALALLLGALAGACGDGDASKALNPAAHAPATAPPDREPGPVRTRPPVLPTAAPGTRALWFESGDGTGLVGRLFGDDSERSRGVVLVHSADTDMTSWFPLADMLMDHGYAVLAFDLRGFGQSEGERDPDGYDEDVAGAIETLGLFGATSIGVVGAGEGGAAAVARGWPEPAKAVVTVGSDVSPEARGREQPLLELEASDRLDDASLMADIERFIATHVGEP